MRTRFCVRLPALGLWLLAMARTALAVEPDVLFSDQIRRDQVQGQCRALVLKSAQEATDTVYRKALCLLYGIDTDTQPALALALLREAAVAGSTEAQLTLADTLQKGGNADQVEALRWYAQAASAGDVRAAGRHARLLQRRQTMAASLPDSTASDTSGYGDGMPASRDGYHCHISGLGKKFCHTAFD